MRRLIAALAILAVVFVVGCQDTKKVTELQGQVDKLNQQITEMQTMVVAKLTAERDSLQQIISDAMAKGGKIQMPGVEKPGTEPTGTKPPQGGRTGGGSAPTGKPPKSGR